MFPPNFFSIRSSKSKRQRLRSRDLADTTAEGTAPQSTAATPPTPMLRARQSPATQHKGKGEGVAQNSAAVDVAATQATGNRSEPIPISRNNQLWPAPTRSPRKATAKVQGQNDAGESKHRDRESEQPFRPAQGWVGENATAAALQASNLKCSAADCTSTSDEDVGLQLEALLTGTPSSADLDPSMLPVYVTDLGSAPAADAPIVERASLKRRFSRILPAAGSDAGSAATASPRGGTPDDWGWFVDVPSSSGNTPRGSLTVPERTSNLSTVESDTTRDRYSTLGSLGGRSSRACTGEVPAPATATRNLGADTMKAQISRCADDKAPKKSGPAVSRLGTKKMTSSNSLLRLWSATMRVNSVENFQSSRRGTGDSGVGTGSANATSDGGEPRTFDRVASFSFDMEL